MIHTAPAGASPVMTGRRTGCGEPGGTAAGGL